MKPVKAGASAPTASSPEAPATTQTTASETACCEDLSATWRVVVVTLSANRQHFEVPVLVRSSVDSDERARCAAKAILGAVRPWSSRHRFSRSLAPDRVDLRQALAVARQALVALIHASDAAAGLVSGQECDHVSDHISDHMSASLLAVVADARPMVQRLTAWCVTHYGQVRPAELAAMRTAHLDAVDLFTRWDRSQARSVGDGGGGGGGGGVDGASDDLSALRRMAGYLLRRHGTRDWIGLLQFVDQVNAIDAQQQRWALGHGAARRNFDQMVDAFAFTASDCEPAYHAGMSPGSFVRQMDLEGDSELQAEARVS